MRRHLRLGPGEAVTEGGGLLGLGGVQVSDAEKGDALKFRVPWPSECNFGTRRDSSMADVFGISR
jgi:hypothetical protein